VSTEAAENYPAPGIVYTRDTKFDKPFNERAWRGVERFERETGVMDYEIKNGDDNQRVQAVSELIRHGVPAGRARHCAAM
jgi:basic membrane lipoprotein Med (substrate-binding protein (PBP1-ABC) superfamily)